MRGVRERAEEMVKATVDDQNSRANVLGMCLVCMSYVESFGAEMAIIVASFKCYKVIGVIILLTVPVLAYKYICMVPLDRHAAEGGESSCYLGASGQ